MIYKLIINASHKEIYFDFDNTLAIDTKASKLFLKIALAFCGYPRIFAFINFFRTLFMRPNKEIFLPEKLNILTSRLKYDRFSVLFFSKYFLKKELNNCIFRTNLLQSEGEYKIQNIKQKKIAIYYEDNLQVAKEITKFFITGEKR